VNDLLTLAVLDARAPIKHRPVDLAGIVQDGMRHVDPGQIRVEERIAGPCVVTGNPTHLTRVVTNLVSNAIRHARSAVVVQLNNTDTHTVLTVVDDGPGVPQQHRRRIWQRFVRLDDDRNRSSGGSGLGLALVREIVVAHGGAVRVVDAVPGPGAAFGVRLPLREAQ
jgi:signal transduction histidine kinase